MHESLPTSMFVNTQTPPLPQGPAAARPGGVRPRPVRRRPLRADRALCRRRADDEGGRGGARRDLPQRRADGEWEEGNRKWRVTRVDFNFSC